MACDFFRRLLAWRSRQAQPARHPPATSLTQPRPQADMHQTPVSQQVLQPTLPPPPPLHPAPRPQSPTMIAPPRKRVKTDQTKPPKIVCKVCFIELKDSYSTPCLSCRAPQCYSCLRTQFVVAIHDHERMPARCCARVLHPDVARGISEPGELEVYKQKYDEFSTPNPFYCPVPTCSAFIPPRMLKPVNGKVICHVCNTVSCVKCKDVASEDHNCAKINARTSILATFNYKLCPKCGTGIMRMYGCPHVRCQCGAHWCWDCQRPIRACNLKPCSVARADGDVSDGRDSEPLTPLLEGGEDTDTAPPLSLEPPVAEMTVMPTADNNRLTATQSEEGVRTNLTNAETAEEVINLDDPDGHDWEVDSFDFGDEPSEEQWDLWGCQHRFQKFTKDLVHGKWMTNMDLSKEVEVECMKCFLPVKILEEEMETEHAKQIGVHSATPAAAAAPANLPVPTRTEIAAERPQTKPASREGAFECAWCGVVYCWRCRRSALQQMKQLRKSVSY